MEIKEIIKLYKEVTRKVPERVEKLPGAGSSRRYYRIFDGEKTAIATFSDDPVETEAFIALTKWLSLIGMKVPRIIARSETDRSLYIQSDCGSQSLFDLIADWQKTKKAFDSSSNDEDDSWRREYEFKEKELIEMLRKSVSALVDIQNCGVELTMEDKLMRPFSLRQILWDLNYFKYCFLKPSGVIFDEDRLENDFGMMATFLLSYPEEMWGFMYRDFQSRNIMLDGENLTLIDYQGGRRGPGIYDLVSLLWQAKAGFSERIREEIISHYIKEYSFAIGKDAEKDIRSHLPLFIFFRTLQVLGAYGFRGLIEKKAHFIESIPYALDNLAQLLKEGVADDYPELKRCCEGLLKLRKKFESQDRDKLRVEVFSFSYKKGYPEDFSGNGGGFMFDCRGMHNPGRYDEYKQLTGLDAPVIEFLEERGEVRQFLEGAWMMVAPSVDSYRRRGFKNLQVGFGCTGGQHRSVYCAQHLAERLVAAYPDIEVLLTHRERGLKEFKN